MATEGGTTTAGVSTSDTHCGRAQREETNYACHDSYIHIIVCTVCAVALYGVIYQRMKLQSDIGRFPSICGTCPSKINMFCQLKCLNDIW